MKRAQPHDHNTGRFVARRSPDGADKLHHDERVIERRHMRRGMRLEETLFGSDRKMANAMRREAEVLGGELGEGPLPPSAAALISSIVLTRVRRDTMAAFVVQLGPRAFNRNRREAYRIVGQLNDMERLLADLLAQFQQLKHAATLEQRLAALENERVLR